jgi:hypothetical protein
MGDRCVMGFKKLGCARDQRGQRQRVVFYLMGLAVFT